MYVEESKFSAKSYKLSNTVIPISLSHFFSVLIYSVTGVPCFHTFPVPQNAIVPRLLLTNEYLSKIFGNENYIFSTINYILSVT